MMLKNKNQESALTCLIRFKNVKQKMLGLKLLAEDKGVITNAGGDRYIVPHDICLKLKEKHILLAEQIAIELAS